MKNKAINLAGKVKAYDDIFKSTSPESQSSGDIVMVELEKLLPFPNHPFKLYSGKKLDELVESIKELGVLNAILIRKISEQCGMYQILSGHNRANAAKLAGLNQIKAEIVDVDDDTAILIVVDSNFKQRDTLLPSEKAFAFKMQIEAKKRQGKRTDLVEDDNHNVKARDIVGKEHKLSGFQVSNYLRLTYLIPELLDMVDVQDISIKVAVLLSYLNREEQLMLQQFITQDKFRIDHEKAIKLRKISSEGGITKEELATIFNEKRPDKKRTINLSRIDLKKFFPEDLNDEEIIQRIYNLLENTILDK